MPESSRSAEEPAPGASEPGDTSLVRHLSIPVEMRDGVRLATEVYLPVGIPLQGVIVERTPYGRKPASWLASRDSYYRYIEHLCLNGCVVVIQDCRGTGDSEGEFVKYVSEADDGFDTLAWIRRQEWWSGRVYLTGRSYSAHAALAAVVAGAPDVHGIFLDCGGFWSAYHEGIRQGGAFEIKQATWAFEAAKRRASENGNALLLGALENQRLEHWVRPTAWQYGQSPLRFLPEDETALLELWDREEYDDYWKQPSLSARGRAGEMAPFPSLHITGWYDLYTLSTVSLFQEMGDRPDGDAYLIIGPWTHCALDEAAAGDVDFGDDATIQGAVGNDYLGMRTQWFSYCAHRSPHFGPRVRFFVMGGGTGRRVRGRLHHGGQWLRSDVWPPRSLTMKRLWLGDRGDLAEAPPREASVLSYRYDPQSPVPTIGGSVGSYSGILAPGAFDQREDSRVFGAAAPFLPLVARPDVLSFATAPLREDLVVVGEIELAMDFTTTGADTDVTVKLVDVYPPSDEYHEGFAMNICDTIVRLRHHEEFEVLASGPGGTTYRVTVTLPPTANRFVAGHSLRIDVSSSNFPRFDVNNNTLDGPRSRRHEVALNGVTVGGADGASLSIPVLEPEAVHASRFVAERSRTSAGLVNLFGREQD